VVISINKDFSGNLTLFCGKIKLSFKLIDTKIKPVSPEKVVQNIYHKPSSNHPWRGTDITSFKKRHNYLFATAATGIRTLVIRAQSMCVSCAISWESVARAD
jgi:hypothetical protein